MAVHVSYEDTIKTSGTDPSGTAKIVPVSGRIALTTTPLAANAVWNTGWIDSANYVSVGTTLYSDVPGSYKLEYSENASGTPLSLPSLTVQYTAVGQARKGFFDPSSRYVRFTYTNGSTAQTMFNFGINLNSAQGQTSNETLNATGADTRTAMWTKTRIETKTSDATNDYAPIYRTNNSLNVNVTNQASTQPVSGSVSVSNFPTTQPVSLASLPSLSTGSNVIGSVNQGTNPWVTRGDRAPTSTTTTVNVTSTSTTVLAANTNRKGATVWAEGILYLLLGTAASQTNYSIKMSTGSYYEVPFNYTGIITAVGATVVVRVSELT